jgi:sugar/nucleoside kinase (ribokinase family)
VIPSFKYLDIFHCNDIEALRITEEKNIAKAADFISEGGVKICAISQGKEGAYIKIQNRILKLPAFTIDSIDPTGAGDAFCSGLIYKLTQEPYNKIIGDQNDIERITLNDWKEIFLYASACGAACCTATGTTTAVKPHIIEKIIHNQKENFQKEIEIH